MLTWICIGVAVQVAWFVVQFTQLKRITIHQFLLIHKENPWVVPIDLMIIAINVLTWPIGLVVDLYNIYKSNKEEWL